MEDTHCNCTKNVRRTKKSEGAMRGRTLKTFKCKKHPFLHGGFGPKKQVAATLGRQSSAPPDNARAQLKRVLRRQERNPRRSTSPEDIARAASALKRVISPTESRASDMSGVDTTPEIRNKAKLARLAVKLARQRSPSPTGSPAPPPSRTSSEAPPPSRTSSEAPPEVSLSSIQPALRFHAAEEYELPIIPTVHSGPGTEPVPVFTALPVAPAPNTDEDRIAKAKRVIELVESTPLERPTATTTDSRIVNPNSKFIVITYWWGNENTNANTKHPCLAYEKEKKKELTQELADEYRSELVRNGGEDGPIPPNDIAGHVERYMQKPEIVKRVNDAYLADLEEQIQSIVKRSGRTEEDARRAVKEEKDAITFKKMIEQFKTKCQAVGCNYFTKEYPFDRPLYQAAINGKPAFIKKVIETCKGLGPGGTDLAIVYIDGDMHANKYPSLFDIDNVDFMARNWNIDPRSHKNYIAKEPCVDPFIFETSGGIQYFANTPGSIELLDTWSLSNLANPGKADDRVLSLAFQALKYILPLNCIYLPIEYLWLTDIYNDKKAEDANLASSIVEHPYCLTAEEAAVGAAASREPEYYNKLVGDIGCENVIGIYYEYLMYPDASYVETMMPYFKYMPKQETYPEEGDPEAMCVVVPFDQRYGTFNRVADANIAASRTAPDMAPTFDIPWILKQLSSGKDVTIGTHPDIDARKDTNIEFIARNKSTKRPTDNSVRPDMVPEFDMEGPFFFSHKNPILYHVLAMCENPAQLTKIFGQSYTILARIRCYWVQ